MTIFSLDFCIGIIVDYLQLYPIFQVLVDTLDITQIGEQISEIISETQTLAYKIYDCTEKMGENTDHENNATD